MSRLTSPLHWDGACSLLSGQTEQRQEQIKIARARRKILLRKPIFIYFLLGSMNDPQIKIDVYVPDGFPCSYVTYFFPKLNINLPRQS
jgi:hypothetical protein